MYLTPIVGEYMYKSIIQSYHGTVFEKNREVYINSYEYQNFAVLSVIWREGTTEELHSNDYIVEYNKLRKSSLQALINVLLGIIDSAGSYR